MSKIEVDAIDKQSGSTLTLGGSGTAVTLACGATQTGFGRTGTVDWQTGSIKTATFTAESGKGYFCNTAGGSFEVDLPTGSAGDIVSVQDYNNTFDSNSLIVDPPAGQKINGGTNGGKITLDTEGEGVTLVFIDSTVGWRSIHQSSFADVGADALFVTASGGTETTSGDFKIHTFTGPGTFTVSSAGNACGSNTVSYVVVAGGAGAGYNRSGGGGAGGFRESKASTDTYTASPLNATSGPGYNLPVSAQAYSIVVGGGGAAGCATGSICTGPGRNGSNSSFSTITAAGGGGGGCANTDGLPISGGRAGGSGGGAGNCSGPDGTPRPGGAGNTPPVSPAQGQNGGASGACTPGNYISAGAGGGGAGAVGADVSVSQQGANGGNGVATQINPAVGSPATNFAGGGGGGGHPAGPATIGTGGTGGGAPGSNGPTPHIAGVANTGGGGGGTGPTASPQAATAGGSGIVIIRYKFQ
jgi:hypothetical protein